MLRIRPDVWHASGMHQDCENPKCSKERENLYSGQTNQEIRGLQERLRKRRRKRVRKCASCSRSGRAAAPSVQRVPHVWQRVCRGGKEGPNLRPGVFPVQA